MNQKAIEAIRKKSETQDLSTAELSKLAGVSHRKLQWWDEQGYRHAIRRTQGHRNYNVQNLADSEEGQPGGLFPYH